MSEEPDQQHSGAERKKIAKSAIDIQEFLEARRDPRVKSFLKEAREYGDRLGREGRIRR